MPKFLKKFLSISTIYVYRLIAMPERFPEPRPSALFCHKFQFIVQLSRHTVGRGLAPAAEKWNIFRIFRRKIIELCLRHGILHYKMPGGRQPAPYDKTVL